jgi:hypothetical protein
MTGPFLRLRTGFGVLAVLVSVAPCWAASLIGTSTTPDAFHSGSRFYAHCANGHYWVGYHDGVEPVLFIGAAVLANNLLRIAHLLNKRKPSRSRRSKPPR